MSKAVVMGERGRRIASRCAVLAAALVVLAARLPSRAAPAPPQPKVPIPGQAATCAACHAGPAAAWASSLHRRTVGAPQVPAERQGCAACHQGAAAHLAGGGDPKLAPTLRGKTGEQVSEICQTCHRGGKQMLWKMSAHARTKDGCLTCHDPHQGVGAEMLKAAEPDLCQKCHPTQVAEGHLPSHHPIAEGKMVCTDCHNVHGDERGNLPETTTGEMCFKCHAEKAGPFLHEHPPVTEDCTVCHRPHGSPVNNLLVQDQPILCLQCHAGHHDAHRTPIVATGLDAASQTAAMDGISAFYTKCTSCHSRIHGSDLSSQTGNGTFMPGRPFGDSIMGESPLAKGAAAMLDPTYFGFIEGLWGQESSHGNQNYVREYDGRHLDRPALSLLDTKYGLHDDYRLEASGLIEGDQDLLLRMGNPLYDLRVSQTVLSHRLGRFNDVPSTYIAGQRGGLQQVPVTDLANGRDDYGIRRTVWDIGLAARHPALPQAKWLLNYWRESERGSRQFLFLDRCDGCHKFQTSEPIDRVTDIRSAGVEVAFNKAIVRYLRGQQTFTNHAPEQFHDFSGSSSSIYNGPAPLFGVASTKTTTNDLRGAAQVSDRVTAAALWRTKDRDNLYGGGKLAIRSTGGGVNWRLSPGLSVVSTASHRTLDVSQTEEGVSRTINTGQVDLRYTGLRNTIASVGFTKEKVDRESERPFVPGESDSDIWRLSLVGQPNPKVWYSLRYRLTTTDASDIVNTEETPVTFPARLLDRPSRGSQFSGILSYNLAGNLLSALYSRQDDRWDVNLPAYAVDRSADNTVTTSGLQLARQQGRARVTAGLYHQTGDIQTDVTYGVADFTLTPPLTADNTVFPLINSIARQHYRANIQLVDGSYALSPKVRLFGRLARTTTDGEVTAYDLGDYLDQNPDLDGVAVTLNPFDITLFDRWLGAGYMVNPTTELVLSLQRRSWTDHAQPSHDGSFDVWRVGMRLKF